VSRIESLKKISVRQLISREEYGSSGIEISKPQDIAKRFTKPFDKAPPAAPG
jgi:hypothetical protein